MGVYVWISLVMTIERETHFDFGVLPKAENTLTTEETK